MDFALSEHHDLLRKTVRDFAQSVVAPVAAVTGAVGDYIMIPTSLGGFAFVPRAGGDAGAPPSVVPS